MPEYYIEIPKRKIGIKIPSYIVVNKMNKDRFCFVECEQDDFSDFEDWMSRNGINYQEM